MWSVDMPGCPFDHVRVPLSSPVSPDYNVYFYNYNTVYLGAKVCTDRVTVLSLMLTSPGPM